MKIVRRKEFLALPPGTVYSFYSPCIFSELRIKWDNCGGNDWLYDDLIGAVANNDSVERVDRCYAMADKGESFPTDFEYTGRDGMYGADDELWAIYEPADVDQLIARLQLANITARGK